MLPLGWVCFMLPHSITELRPRAWDAMPAHHDPSLWADELLDPSLTRLEPFARLTKSVFIVFLGVPPNRPKNPLIRITVRSLPIRLKDFYCICLFIYLFLSLTVGASRLETQMDLPRLLFGVGFQIFIVAPQMLGSLVTMLRMCEANHCYSLRRI